MVTLELLSPTITIDPVPPGVRLAEFFDLEKTLTAHAAEQECALILARRREIPVSSLLRVLAIYLEYNLGLIADFDRMKRSGARIFAGRRPDRDAILAQELFDASLKDFLRSTKPPSSRRSRGATAWPSSTAGLSATASTTDRCSRRSGTPWS